MAKEIKTYKAELDGCIFTCKVDVKSLECDYCKT